MLLYPKFFFYRTVIYFRPELEYIDMIEAQLTNTGSYTIAPANYRLRDNPRTVDMQFGFIQINLTNPEQFNGLAISP